MSGWGSADMIAIMWSEFKEGLIKQIVLAEKYSDFSDIFDKVKADKLLEYLYYDLAIKLINNK